jgi:hypothetical protein
MSKFKFYQVQTDLRNAEGGSKNEDDRSLAAQSDEESEKSGQILAVRTSLAST